VNSDENQELPQAFGIRSIPNVIAFKDGKSAELFMGAIPEGQVRPFFEKLLPSPSELALARAGRAKQN
jgi:putative thioredoxin